MDSFIRIYHEKLKNIEYRMKLLQYFHSQNPEINKFEESLQNIINHIETNFKILQMKFLEAKDLSKELGVSMSISNYNLLKITFKFYVDFKSKYCLNP